jgi:ADP-ribose pyrophosphatase YjhB (NUDIX family)
MNKQLNVPDWLAWAREIQSLCQTGLAHSPTHYDTNRYKRLTEIAAEITAQHTNLEKDSLVENFLVHPGYATPKVDVRSAIFQNKKLLLVREKQDKRWSLPGGWADVGDLPSEVAIREVLEECNLKVKPLKISGVYDANRVGRVMEFFHAFKIIFICQHISGKPQPGDETLDAQFFNMDNLPPLSLQRTHPRHIDHLKAHLEDSALPAFFD